MIPRIIIVMGIRLRHLLLSLILCDIAVAQTSRIIRVPQDRQTIQAALISARAGDTVIVSHGVYFENVRIDKNIVLASQFIFDSDTSHISRTVIDGSRPKDERIASTIFISGPTDTTCEVIGFTIRGGTGSFLSVPEDIISPHWIGGGGVFIRHAGARIAHNIVTQNTLSARPWATYTFGAGIAATDASSGKNIPAMVIIEHNTVVGNTSSGELSEGGGIEVNQPGIIRRNVVMYNKTFSRSRSYGGGIYVGMFANYDVVVDGNYVKRNVAGIGGGMLVTCAFVRQGRAMITNNTIAENEAFEVGGAANIAEESYAVFINNTIIRNRALSTGGGINVTTGTHTVLINNILWQNESDQVSDWGITQAMHNLVQGGLPGKGNISTEPRFLPEDTLYRLSPNSPCIGAGLSHVRLADEPFRIPEFDGIGNMRQLPNEGEPDLGAIESPWESATSFRESNFEGYLKLTVIFQQITSSKRNESTGEIVRAGDMRTTLVVNDTDREVLEGPDQGRSFILPPESNLLDIELIGRARDTSKGLVAYLWLDGTDRHVTMLKAGHASLYHYYAGLPPGEYRLSLQPQDDSRIIGHTNRVSFLVTVLPFWYERWWAYVLYAIIVVAASLVFVKLRLRRLRLVQDLSLKNMETEKLAQLDRLKSRFFANLSHEFRTPLSLILGPADQLEEAEQDPVQKEQLGTIRRNAERLLGMVNLLLQFARIESGTLKLHVALQPIPPLLRRIVSSFSTAAIKKGIALNLEVEPSEFDGYLDSEKIEHILENLLSNALKYSTAGAHVNVRSCRVGTNLQLDVSDTGSGISAEHLPHIFDRFYRVDSSHHHEGTGIGLSLTKELVELHRGSITATSTIGQGTIVSVVIPLSGYATGDIVNAPLTNTPRHIHESKEQEASTTKGIEGDRPVVLVVEDNTDAREYLCSRLAGECEVIAAADGTEAIQMAFSRIPDIIVSDVMMPGMSGYELCAKVKSDERTCHIPVILLTALADRSDKLEGLQTGADDYVVKPFDAQELLVRVRNLVDNRSKVRNKFSTTVLLRPGEVAATSLDEQFLKKVLEVVERQISNELFDVEMFAAEVHLSRTQLHRKLKALTNLSPSDFTRSLRMHRAHELLQKHAGNVSEVMYKVGFTNPSHFTKSFREQFGKLPSDLLNGSPKNASG